jgi:peptidoglycan hydrolase CwlO-like protein
MMDDRGPLDLTKQIDDLEGKVKFLQDTCRRAGAQIKQLEAQLKEATAWKEDEVEKFRNRLRDSAPYEKRMTND